MAGFLLTGSLKTCPVLDNCDAGLLGVGGGREGGGGGMLLAAGVFPCSPSLSKDGLLLNHIFPLEPLENKQRSFAEVSCLNAVHDHLDCTVEQ